MEEVTRLLGLLSPELTRAMGQGQLEDLMSRHQILASGLGGGRISAQVAPLFPRDKAQAILDWYSRLKTGLRHLEKLQRQSWSAACAVGELLNQYPGPRPQPTRMASMAAESGRPSLQGRGQPLCMRGSSTKLEQEVGRGDSDLESYRSDFREKAKQAGLGYRLGGGTPGPSQEGFMSRGFVDVVPTDLPDV